jgi:hypothetical protein
MKPLVASLVGWQAIVCLAGLGVGLFPTVIRTSPFWGVFGAWNSDVPGVSVYEVLAESPAALAGLQEGDHILAVDQTIVRDGYQLDEIWSRAVPGAPMALRVRRGQEEVMLSGVAAQPELGAVGYWDWQLVAGMTFLALGALALATQPMQRGTLWRPIVIAVVGMALAAVIPTVDWGWRLLHYKWQDWTLRGQHPLLQAATIAAAVALVVLAACEVRNILGRRGTGTAAGAADASR